ncbi:Protein of unknown function [Propionibacterium freudenreichii]|nr:Protein of unknown function [Propionibacterium freudenreichii subsp. freudenreichii]CEG85580.1 Protein of unknown function [Propionibacterium freudenreichii]CEG88574.1 Protein of unknown function [Propionibacterium freudenreichii]CEG92752.1 Protein of unknown function [Propionibacterium freudenreichii]CEG96340.1 Protein of unknown function [Propionibacterium freudenreichii]
MHLRVVMTPTSRTLTDGSRSAP